MSFAIIQTGGKQYKVEASEILKIEQLENLKPESKIEFNEILAYGDDKNIEVGSPLVKGAKVEAELLKNDKNKTILIFKKRRRKNSRRKNGHRQLFSLIKIKKIFSIKEKLYRKLPTIPSTLKEELETNIFLRCNSVESFSKLRDLKDNF